MAEKSPKISIIVPVYNAEKTLNKCMDSIISQSFTDWELLLVDDGSTDGSGVLCDEYAAKDSRIRVFHKANGGVSSARNLGLDNVTGEWVVFCDSDDYWIGKDSLGKLYESAIKHNADIVRGCYRPVDGQGKDLPFRGRPIPADLCHCPLQPAVFLQNAVQGEFFLPLLLLRKSICPKFNANQVFLEDMDFLIHLIVANEKLVCMQLPLTFYAYRKTGVSVSSRLDVRKLRDSFAMSKRFEEAAGKVQDDSLRHYFLYYSVMMYHWTLQTLAEDDYYKERDKLIGDLELRALRCRVFHTALKHKIINKAVFTISVPPRVGLFMFRVNNSIKTRLWNTPQ